MAAAPTWHLCCGQRLVTVIHALCGVCGNPLHWLPALVLCRHCLCALACELRLS